MYNMTNRGAEIVKHPGWYDGPAGMKTGFAPLRKLPRCYSFGLGCIINYINVAGSHIKEVKL